MFTGNNANLLPLISALPGSLKGSIHFGDAGGAGQKAMHSILKNLRRTTGIGNNHHPSTEHRLDLHQREAFGATGQYQTMVLSPDLLRRCETGNTHLLKPEKASHSLQALLHGSLAIEAHMQRTSSPLWHC